MNVHPASIVRLRASGSSAGEVAWHEWSTVPFHRARTERKPILLAIMASWCARCAEMDRTSYRRPDVVALVNERFVPIRIDADRRPDLNERYNLGGWPTTAFLTPDGNLLGGATFVHPDDFAAVLTQVADAFDGRRAEIDERSTALDAQRHEPPGPIEATRSTALDPEAVGWLSEHLLARVDPQYGGFGVGPKFPHASALAFLLARYAGAGDVRLGDAVTLTLDAMGRLYDEVEGGFFHYAAERDWSGPHHAKILSDQASLIPLHLDAAQLFGRSDYRDRALGTLRYVETRLTDDPNGGFFGSQRADAAYYAHDTDDARERAGRPPVDRTYYVGWNAQMAAVCLAASKELDDVSLRDRALAALEAVVLAAYRPGNGVAHCLDGRPGVWGLLADQVQAASALALASALTGQLPHAMLAEELMAYTVRTMWDPTEGGFFDRASQSGGDADCGLLRERLKPIEANSEAARALVRLAALLDKPEYARRAVETLAAQAASYRGQGVGAAPYGVALLDAQHAIVW